MMVPQCLEALTERAEEERALVLAAQSDTAAPVSIAYAALLLEREEQKAQ
ncbi:MAG TPA: hypothetical protein VJA21_23035 [Verrucomicrobiae bacterium]